jgi:putative NADPH-quinone reductase
VTASHASTPRRIALIQGHPDPGGGHFGHALADAYAEAAAAAGHEVRRIDVARLRFPLLRSKEEWDAAEPAGDIAQAQQTLAWANHLLILYPLWLGCMPALLKAFFEQALRPGFAADRTGGATGWRKRLAGRSARIVVTMGMPAFVFRWYFRAHGLRVLERNILAFSGVGPVSSCVIGSVESPRAGGRERWMRRMRGLGARAA